MVYIITSVVLDFLCNSPTGCIVNSGDYEILDPRLVTEISPTITKAHALNSWVKNNNFFTWGSLAFLELFAYLTLFQHLLDVPNIELAYFLFQCNNRGSWPYCVLFLMVFKYGVKSLDIQDLWYRDLIFRNARSVIYLLVK